MVQAQLEISRDDCDDLFEEYRRCVLLGMKNDVEKKGVVISKGSALGEFLEEEGEDL